MILSIMTPAFFMSFIFCPAFGDSLSGQEIAQVLKIHNDARRATGGTDVNALTWDYDMARKASEHANTCSFRTKIADKNLGGLYAAQTAKTNAVRDMVRGWKESGEADYNLRTGTCADGQCGHYKQMIWSTTTKIGCGKATCPSDTVFKTRDGIFLACYYSPARLYTDKKPVHFGGVKCSKCNLYPGTRCDDGLCTKCYDSRSRSDCRKYDASQCFDAKVDVKDCSWVKESGYCDKEGYHHWTNKNCAKTCRHCHS